MQILDIASLRGKNDCFDYGLNLKKETIFRKPIFKEPINKISIWYP